MSPEVSSNGGPEFVAKETEDFFQRWGICHRVPSVSLPSSNGRAELAVKMSKHLLMDTVGPSGELDTDGMVRVLPTQRNTPDAGCQLSPAQILFGRPLRDTLPYIDKNLMAFNNPQVDNQWKNAWKLKEEAMNARYIKTLESLNEHKHPLLPLRHGDNVFVRNQCGRFPNKWDRSGVIVEVKDHNQYVVKIARIGRLTLRNRRFLRHFQQGPHWGFDCTLKEKNCTDKLRYHIDETSMVHTGMMPMQKQTDTTSDVGSRMNIEVPGTIDNKHSCVGTPVTTFMPPSSDNIVDHNHRNQGHQCLVYLICLSQL